MAYRKASPSNSYQREICETYFVEPYVEINDGFDMYRAGAKERLKHLDRDRQLVIAEEMSRMASEEYQDDILKHMKQMEVETAPDVASIDIQTEIKWYMRPYLIDFLIEAHGAFQLLPETLFLAVNLLDRYCSRRIVYKRHYQLVGCAALLIAAKYGDRKDRVPTIRELKSMCCSLYDDDMFIQMEWHVLQTLGWAVGHPTVDAFLQMALSEESRDTEVEHMARYIAEIALFHKDFVSTLSSTMARSALALARCVLGRTEPSDSEWAANMGSFTVVSLSRVLGQPSQVLSHKYSSPHFSRVAYSLENFLAEQAKKVPRYEAPPTPPSELPATQEQKEYSGEAYPQTPQKGQHPANMPHGYLTPPITPEGEYFIGSSMVPGRW